MEESFHSRDIALFDMVHKLLEAALFGNALLLFDVVLSERQLFCSQAEDLGH